MKRIVFGVLVIWAIVSLAACDVTDNYALSAKIDGQLWLSEKGVAAAKGTDAIIMNALSNSKPAIALSIKNFTVGTHPLDSLNNGFLYAFQGDQMSGFYATTAHPGELIISEHNEAKKFIKGTFHLEAYNYLSNQKIKVEEGKFEITYQ